LPNARYVQYLSTCMLVAFFYFGLSFVDHPCMSQLVASIILIQQ
jgi:hypothetical protein